MTQPYSQLAYRQIDPTDGESTVTIVALHGHKGGHDDLLPLASSLGSDVRIVAPEAARGVYQSVHLLSRTWFGGTCVRPEPASFGDSLAQIERLIYDVRARDNSGNPVWLLGYDQGAVLALSLALIAPDLIDGVMGIGGGLPAFSDPTLLDPIDGALPILLVGDQTTEISLDASVEAARSRLAQLGNRVTVRWIAEAANRGEAATQVLQTWFRERHG